MMTETELAWERLLDYRQRVRSWVRGDVPLADTRLRVSRLLDGGFGYGWDDVEADFQAMGHRADFALAIDGHRWGVVLVRAMGSGIGDGPPPEAFVLADGAGLRWTWVTDGVGLTVFHVGLDFVARPIVTLDLIHDDDGPLRHAWDLICREGIVTGRLETHRLSLLRPDPAAIRHALQDPAVLNALRQVLSHTFPNPGTDLELIRSLDNVVADDAWDDTPDSVARNIPEQATPARSTPSVPAAVSPPSTSPTPAPATTLSNAVPDDIDESHTPVTPPATNGTHSRHRRGDGHDTAEPQNHTPEPIDVPTIPITGQAMAAPTPSPEAAPTEPPMKASPSPDENLPRRYRRQEPPSDTLLTAMEKQRQTHERLRQNLRDLKENRARLQDALSELQRDYPERFERHTAPPAAEPVEVGAKPASWTLLGHLQSMGNGYWEWCASDNGGPGVRLN